MPYFTYRAKDGSGNVIEKSEEAFDADSLVTNLQTKGFLVLSLKEEAERPRLVEITPEAAKEIFGEKKKRKFRRSVKLDDMILFSRQFSAMLDSGVDLLRSLRLMEEQVEAKPLFAATQAIIKDIEGGSSLRDAIAKHPKIFPSLWINMIEVGEATGELPAVLIELAKYLENQARLVRKIKGAITYPILLAIVGAIAIVVFMVRIIPIFHGILSGFGFKLPLLTQVVFNMSMWIKTNLIKLIIGFIAAAFVLVRALKTEGGRRVFDKSILKVPLIGALMKGAITVRFARGLSMLIKSGTPLLYSLEIVAKISNNKIVESSLIKARESVREGKSMAESIRKDLIFPPLVPEMVAIGEETGKVTDMLDRLGDFFDERVTASVDRLSNLFEPMMLLFMGAIVGTLIVAMYLPIFSISGMGGGGAGGAGM